MKLTVFIFHNSFVIHSFVSCGFVQQWLTALVGKVDYVRPIACRLLSISPTSVHLIPLCQQVSPTKTPARTFEIAVKTFIHVAFMMSSIYRQLVGANENQSIFLLITLCEFDKRTDNCLCFRFNYTLYYFFFICHPASQVSWPQCEFLAFDAWPRVNFPMNHRQRVCWYRKISRANVET